MPLGVNILMVLLATTGFCNQASKSRNAEINPIRVACVGDSITELTNYTTCLSELLGKNYIVGNFGVCGSMVSLDSDYAYMHSEAFVEAENFKPDFVVVMLGTNDANLNLKESLTPFVEDYLVLIEKIQALESKPPVWIVKPPPIFNEALGYSVDGLANGVIPGIEEAARRAEVPIIDVYSALNSSHYFSDGVHPNVEGAKVIARIVCHAIVSR